APAPLGYGHDKRGTAMGDAVAQPSQFGPTPKKDAESLIRFTLDGNELDAPHGETIYQTAHRCGIELPRLCYSPEPGYRPDGNCRACMVEIEGERVLAASCI